MDEQPHYLEAFSNDATKEKASKIKETEGKISKKRSELSLLEEALDPNSAGRAMGFFLKNDQHSTNFDPNLSPADVTRNRQLMKKLGTEIIDLVSQLGTLKRELEELQQA